MNKELSVIIPAYNEETHIANTLKEVSEYLRLHEYTYEILVINDGSRDGTAGAVRAAAANDPSIQFIHRDKNLGKGQTVREGVEYARFPICLFMDADNSTSIKEWGKFERCFEKGYTVVTASRHLPESEIVCPQPWSRRFLGAGYRFLSRLLFELTISDFNCGFKAYETGLAKKIYSEVKMCDWTFDVEVFCLLKKSQCRIAEVPVHWEHRDKKGGIVPLSTSLRSLKSLLKLKLRFC